MKKLLKVLLFVWVATVTFSDMAIYNPIGSRQLLQTRRSSENIRFYRDNRSQRQNSISRRKSKSIEIFEGNRRRRPIYNARLVNDAPRVYLGANSGDTVYHSRIAHTGEVLIYKGPSLSNNVANYKRIGNEILVYDSRKRERRYIIARVRMGDYDYNDKEILVSLIQSEVLPL